jgi:hypothetical protein
MAMPKRSTDAALDEIREVHAKWLAGTLASEDALFQISDVIQAHDAAARTKAKPALVTA